jgi:hypothetical protein
MKSTNRKTSARVCVMCGYVFMAYNQNARTCTETCRKRLSRQRKAWIARQAPDENGGIEVHATVAAPSLSALQRFLRLPPPRHDLRL